MPKDKTTDDGPVSARVLRNRGVPIDLAVLDDEGRPRYDDDGPIVETVYLRVDGNAAADIEEAFDGTEAVVDLTKISPVVNDETGEPVRNAKGEIVQVEEIVGQEVRPHYGVSAFAAAMEQSPGRAVRTFVAICLDAWPDRVREVGARMLPEKKVDYANAVGIAWALANGVDPTTASEMLKNLADASAAVTEKADLTLAESVS